MTAELWLCETATAGSVDVMMSPHIREISDEGPRTGGGADTPALCGSKVAWDIRPFEPFDDDPQWTCAGCLKAHHRS